MGAMVTSPNPADPNRAAIAGLTLLYLGGMAFSCLVGRMDGGVAMVWVPGSILAAWLYRADRRNAVAGLIACALANELGAGLFGMGWTAGIGLTLANLAEAVAAALLVRHTLRAHWPHGTFEIASQFLLGAALVIPAGSALIAAATVRVVTGGAFVPTFRIWMLGHAVGLTALLPFAVMAALRLNGQRRSAQSRQRAEDTAAPRPAPSHRPIASALMVLTMALLTACVFLQDLRWPLVAPLLFALFAAVWADVLIATAMPMLVALIAAPLTVAGLGPIAPGLAQAADRLQLGLLYAGLIACCALPVVVEQARRRQQIAMLSRSNAHFQAMSQRADTLIDELRRAALTDPLTLLPNRRAFFERLTAQAASDEPGCLAMIDIDHFKRVNDRYGHAAGDTVLRHFADLARSCFRSGDMVGRIGGEEFAVILRGVDLDQACKVCQRLVDKLADTEIVTASGPVRVTISSGVVVIGSDGEAAMAAADSAMYEAKRGGRSRLSSVA